MYNAKNVPAGAVLLTLPQSHVLSLDGALAASKSFARAVQNAESLGTMEHYLAYFLIYAEWYLRVGTQVSFSC